MTSSIKDKVKYYVDEPHPKMVLAKIIKEKKVSTLSIKEVSIEKISNIFDQKIRINSNGIN